MKEAIWLKGMIGDLGISEGCVKIYCDSQIFIHLTNHQVYQARIKNLNICLHFIRDVIEFKEIAGKKITSKDNSMDVFSKSLPRSRFKYFLDLYNFFEKFIQVWRDI